MLTFFEPPQRRRQCTNVHGLGCNVQDVVQNTANFAVQNTDQLRAARYFYPRQLLNRQTPCVLLVHRCHVIQTVEIRQVLQISTALHQLLCTTVQQANMRIATLYDFTIQLQNQTQHAVRGRVLWTKVNVEITNTLFARLGVVEITVSHHFASALSSPGRMYSAPSHGDMKSN